MSSSPGPGLRVPIPQLLLQAIKTEAGSSVSPSDYEQDGTVPREFCWGPGSEDGMGTDGLQPHPQHLPQAPAPSLIALP